MGQPSCHPVVQLGSLFGIGFFPSLFLCLAFGDKGAELVFAFFVHLGHFRTDDKRILRVSPQVLYRVDIGIASQRCAMGFAVAFIRSVVRFPASFSHHAVADDEGGTVLLLLCGGQCLTDLFAVVAVNFQYIPVPSAVFHARVFRNHGSRLGRQLDFVGIEEHDQVVQSQVSGYTSSPLGYLLLNAAVGNIGIDFFLVKARIASSGIKSLGSDGGTHCVGMSLSKGAAGVFNTPFEAHLRVSRCGRTPLAELHEVLYRVVANQRQLRI